MAWTTPLTAVSNSALTASQWNASVRDNLNETAPAKATAAGQFFASTGVNAIAARLPTADSIATTEPCAGTSFGNLATVGPTVTVTTGTQALIIVQSRITVNTAGETGRVGWTVSGATTLAATDDLSYGYEASNANDNLYSCGAWLFNGLTPGSNTIRMVYKTSAGTANFASRRLSVVPF